MAVKKAKKREQRLPFQGIDKKNLREKRLRERATLASVFLGPKAENGDILVRLITDVLVDYIHWRRNFHPEDPPVIREWNKQEEAFETHFGDFIQNLDSLLGMLKRNDVPFASPRYIGHMLSDQLMPAIVGYFAGMLYNPNNVTKEASPHTTDLEEEFGERLCRLVGYDPKQGWSHLTSGGTVANLEALWVARNLKYLPLAIRLLAEKRKVNISVDLNGRTTSITSVTLWGLLNCDVEETLSIFDTGVSQLVKSGVAEDNNHAAELFKKESISWLGVEEFFNQVQGCLHKAIEEEFPEGLKPSVIVVPSTAHYSLIKISELLGLGRGESRLKKMPVTDTFRMNEDALEDYLSVCVKTRTPVIAVVSFCGSTEEGAIDPINKIEDLRERLKNDLKFYHHCDGAYGGYVRTLVYNSGGEVDPPDIRSRVEHKVTKLKKTQLSWPSEPVAEAIKAIPKTDSVTIDPHKLGYVPYPAGAIVFRQKRVRDVIALFPGYLEQPLIGSYILEGSKPGAAAAACWLASETLPLRQSGHGILIERAISNAYTLADALRELGERLLPEVRLQVINYPPDLNIVCFVFNFRRGEADPLCFMNAYMEEVYHQFLKFDEEKALSAHEIILSKTEFRPEEHDRAIIAKFLRSVKVEPGNFCTRTDKTNWDNHQSDDKVFVLRCTVMNPWLGARVTRSREVGPEKVPLEELTFVCRFVTTLERHIKTVWEQKDVIDEKVLAERKGSRKIELPRLGRLFVGKSRSQ